MSNAQNIPDKLLEQACVFPASGRGWYVSEIGFMLAWGTTVPSDGSTGYGKGGFFMDSSAGTVYTNTGDVDSSAFTISTAAPGSAEINAVSAAVVSDALLVSANVVSIAAAESELDLVSEAVVSDALLRAAVLSELTLVSAAVSATESDLLVEKSTVNDVSEALVSETTLISTNSVNIATTLSELQLVSAANVAAESHIKVNDSEVSVLIVSGTLAASGITANSGAIAAIDSAALIDHSNKISANSALITDAESELTLVSAALVSEAVLVSTNSVNIVAAESHILVNDSEVSVLTVSQTTVIDQAASLAVVLNTVSEAVAKRDGLKVSGVTSTVTASTSKYLVISTLSAAHLVGIVTIV